jgi:hypothetical protein
VSNAEQVLTELKEWLVKGVQYMDEVIFSIGGQPQREISKRDTMKLVLGKIEELDRYFKH